MPVVKKLGAAGTARRDKVAKALIKEGKPPSNAYAIATAQTERNAGVRPKKKRRKR